MKKKLIALILTLALALSMVACGSSSKAGETAASDTTAADTTTETTADAAGNAAANTSDMKLAVVLHAMNSSFYNKMADGAKAAGADLGITVDVTSPTTASSLTEQVNLIETCISSGYDGIATVTWDQSGFNSVIAKAAEAGIPMVGFNQNAEGCGTRSFIGQDYEEAGYQLGKYMFGEVMGGKGSYIVASCAPADSALIARTAGIARAAEEYPDVKFIEVIDIGTDLTNANSVIENAYLANPDVNAIIGVDVYSEAIGTFINAYGIQDKVKAGGFDLTEGTLKHIANGDMQCTIGQNPFMQGYYSVMELYMNKAYGSDFVNIDTGAQMITAENVNDVEPE